MKKIIAILSVSLFVQSGYAEDGCHDFLCALSASATSTVVFPIYGLTVVAMSPTGTTVNAMENKRARHSFMVEVSPAAAQYLSTGQGLDNHALVRAMYLVSEEDNNQNLQESALRIIEEANGKYQNESAQ